jgi:hypothetical protein
MLPTFISGWDATALKARVATGDPPLSEAEHYFRCEACGGYFDMRDLNAVPIGSYTKLACFLERVDSILAFGHCHGFRERVHRAGFPIVEARAASRD